MSDKIISYGGGINSTAILALVHLKELYLEEQVKVIFADTGAEQKETYEYIHYLQQLGQEIIIVQAKEGSLADYCEAKGILPMRFQRWCTDKWKRRPINKKLAEIGLSESVMVIGIDAGESHRAARWRNDTNVDFPLLRMGIDRKKCKEIIMRAGWKVPKKSGCWLCPFAKSSEFKDLMLSDRETFYRLCKMESVAVKRSHGKLIGWYNERYPLQEFVLRDFPEEHKEQTGMCCFCEIS